MNQDTYEVLTPDIRHLRETLETHPVFERFADLERLRAFMQVHVFAVWDFMSLAKRLQRDLTCLDVPWIAPTNPTAARMINEIVLAEESDVDAQNRPASHLDLYLTAMGEVGASPAIFLDFMSRLKRGEDLHDALLAAQAPEFVRAFVQQTIDTAKHASTIEVMASFYYGRENIIPFMFRSLLHRWGLTTEQAPGFVYYVRRHIELDDDSHGPAANQLIQDALSRNPQGLHEARESARRALIARHALWDGAAALMLRG